MFETDLEWLKKHQATLQAKYKGQFVAVFDGAVVDHGDEFDSVARRAYEKYGYRDIVISRIDGEDTPLRVPSPRTRTASTLKSGG